MLFAYTVYYSVDDIRYRKSVSYSTVDYGCLFIQENKLMPTELLLILFILIITHTLLEIIQQTCMQIKAMPVTATYRITT